MIFVFEWVIPILLLMSNEQNLYNHTFSSTESSKDSLFGLPKWGLGAYSGTYILLYFLL